MVSDQPGRRPILCSNAGVLVETLMNANVLTRTGPDSLEPLDDDSPQVLRDPRRARRRGLGWLLLAAVIAATAFVHLFRLKTGDGADDEDAYVRSAWAYVHGDLRSHLEHPPLVRYLFGYAQEWFGMGYSSARLVSGIAGLLTAIVLAIWAYRLVGLAGAIWAGALWGLLPHGSVMGGWSAGGFRIERLALLDPTATLFVALALWAGWEARSKASPIWAAAAGVAVAFAATSKAPGVLVAPVILVALTFTPDVLREWKKAALRAAAFAGGAVAATIVAYLPFGVHGATHQIKYMFHFQSIHQAHWLLLGNELVSHAPWWAGLRFMADGMGWPGTALLVALAVCGLFSPNRAVTIYGLAATAVTYFGIAQSGRMLPYYYIIWVPGLIIAAAMGARYVLTLALTRRHLRLLVPVSAIILAAIGINAVATTATTGPGDYGRVAQLLTEANVQHVYIVGDANLLGRALRPRKMSIREELPPSSAIHDIFVADQLTTHRVRRWLPIISNWAQQTAGEGYRHVRVGRMDVWILH
jgi:4-amino-4-deoxy-L-arabinose transferase-like glycosyltransferase